jgi:hypothetical protein
MLYIALQLKTYIMKAITNESFEGSYLTHLKNYKKQLLNKGYNLEAEEVETQINEIKTKK